uniref:Uncharacterized protein n=1 Tax=Globodera rostochiensis TaxID=31243 RepID=A0A914I3K2_GLORO
MMLKKFIFLALFISIFLVTTVKSNDDSGENIYDAFGEHLGESVVKSNDNSGEDDDDEHLGESATEIVADFLSNFPTVSSSIADVGFFMDHISLSAFALLKLALRVGSLIAGALNITTKTESEEYRALMKLHDTMEVKFEEISRTIMVATKVVAKETKLHDYINTDELLFFGILPWSKVLTLQGTPLGILNYIYSHTVENCHGLSAQQISLLAEFVPLLRQIRMQLSSDFAKKQFDELTPDLNIWFSNLGRNTAKTVLKKIEEGIDTSKTYDSAQAALSLVNLILKETEIEQQQNSICLLQDIITGNNYHRKAVEELESIIRFDVLKMMVFGSICANITWGGDKQEMDWFQKQLFVTAKAIVDNLKAYIPTELDNSFPKIETGVVKTIISEMGLKPPVTTIHR